MRRQESDQAAEYREADRERQDKTAETRSREHTDTRTPDVQASREGGRPDKTRQASQARQDQT
jgi:hypothetical protein